MNLKKHEPEKSYAQPSYHINKVLLFIILYKIITSKIFFCYLWVYITHVSPVILWISS